MWDNKINFPLNLSLGYFTIFKFLCLIPTNTFTTNVLEQYYSFLITSYNCNITKCFLLIATLELHPMMQLISKCPYLVLGRDIPSSIQQMLVLLAPTSTKQADSNPLPNVPHTDSYATRIKSSINNHILLNFKDDLFEHTIWPCKFSERIRKENSSSFKFLTLRLRNYITTFESQL